MIALADLMSAVRGVTLIIRAAPGEERPITRVTLVEQLTAVDALQPGCLGVLARGTAGAAGGYQLDVLVRHAAQREVAALLLRRSTQRSITAEALAVRGGVALLDADDEVDPAVLLDELITVVGGDARSALRGLAIAASLELTDDPDDGAVVARIGEACGVSLRYESAQDATGLLVHVDGRRRGAVRSLDPGDIGVVAARLAATRLAELIGRRERLVLTPIRSTSTALSQLLLCSQANLAMVSERASEAGLPVGGWHCAARVAVTPAAATDGDGPTADAGELPDLEHEVVQLLAERETPQEAFWAVARPDDTVVLVRTTRADHARGAPREVAAWVSELTETLHGRHPGAHFRIGVATQHEGAAGLRVSAEESRTALAAARLVDEPVSVAMFDSLGAQRMLAEWLVTDTARDTVRELLAPLDALGVEKSAVAVETLHAYLDERGSLVRAAARLHLHRNAVVYRIGQLTEVLGLDLTDPDTRFALQLACRARLMSEGRL